ncbi:Uncharacterised protein [uncultured archaeon]|nr:Uncharacterised protein [uncultured archaeon]
MTFLKIHYEIMSSDTPSSDLPESDPSLLSERLHWRGPAGSEPVLCRPGTINLCSSALLIRIAKPYVNAPSRGATLGAFICGSKFSDAKLDRTIKISQHPHPMVVLFLAKASQIQSSFIYK